MLNPTYKVQCKSNHHNIPIMVTWNYWSKLLWNYAGIPCNKLQAAYSILLPLQIKTHTHTQLVQIKLGLITYSSCYYNSWEISSCYFSETLFQRNEPSLQLSYRTTLPTMNYRSKDSLCSQWGCFISQEHSGITGPHSANTRCRPCISLHPPPRQKKPHISACPLGRNDSPKLRNTVFS